MSNKLITGPIVLRAASLTLAAASAFTNIVGTVDSDNANATSGAVKLGALDLVAVRFSYTRGASGGAPIVRAYGSLDATTTAADAVTNWQPVLIMDSSTLSAGQVELYPEAQELLPSVAGAVILGTHPLNVTVFNWLLVQIADNNATPGAVTNCRPRGLLVSTAVDPNLNPVIVAGAGGGGGGAPSGPAGGDLAGTYPDPTVGDLTITSEARGDLLRRNASAWGRFAASTANTFVGGDGTDVTTRTAAQVLASLYPTQTVTLASATGWTDRNGDAFSGTAAVNTGTASLDFTNTAAGTQVFATIGRAPPAFPSTLDLRSRLSAFSSALVGDSVQMFVGDALAASVTLGVQISGNDTCTAFSSAATRGRRSPWRASATARGGCASCSAGRAPPPSSASARRAQNPRRGPQWATWPSRRAGASRGRSSRGSATATRAAGT
jgi:hypothetical protein